MPELQYKVYSEQKQNFQNDLEELKQMERELLDDLAKECHVLDHIVSSL